MRTLAEDVAVIALFPAVPVPATDLDRVSSAAALVDLVLLRRIELVDGRVRLRDPSRTGDALLDEAAARVGSSRRLRAPSVWVGASAGASRAVLDRLAADGSVRVTRPATRFRALEYEVVDSESPRALRAGLRAALLAGGGLDARAAALAALAVAAGMAGRLLVLDERAHARDRVRRALRPEDRLAAVEAIAAAVRGAPEADGGWHADAGDGRSVDGGATHGDGGGGDGGGDGGGGGGGD